MSRVDNLQIHVRTFPIRRVLAGLFVILLSIVVGVVATGFIHRRAAAKGPAPALFIDPADLRVDTRFARKELGKTLRLDNKSDQTIVIREFTASCGCTSITPQSLTIPPGESREITIVASLQFPPNKDQIGVSHDFTIDFAAVVEGGTSPAAWKLSGSARSPLVPSVLAIEFEMDELNSKVRPYPSRRVELTCLPEVRNVIALSNPPGIVNASIEPSVQGGTHVLSVTPCNELPIGPFKCTVDFQVTDDAGEIFLATPLAVRGLVVDDLELSPTSVRFQPATIGAELSQEIIVRSRTGERFSISTSGSLPAGVSAIPDNDEMRDVHVLTFKQKVLAGGNHDNKVGFDVNSKDSDKRSIEIEVAYWGLDKAEQPPQKASLDDQ